MKRQSWQERLLQKYYFGLPNWENGRKQFFRLIEQFTQRGSHILEVGAGPTNKTTRFLSTIGRVTGLDIDPAVKTNEHCREVVVYDGTHIPFENDSFDLAVLDYVCEHVEHPLKLAREIHRVLRPGGYIAIRTPNLWHYVSLVAKLTPQWFHNRVANPIRGLPMQAHEPYPTYHRMNTKRACCKILTDAGFWIESLRMIESEPSYGMASRFLFYPLMIWERILNASDIFQNLRSNILSVASAKK